MGTTRVNFRVFAGRMLGKHSSMVGTLLITFFAACAPAIVQQSLDKPFDPASGKQLLLVSQVDVELSTGYGSTLNSNSRWELVGVIDSGEVYKPRDQILTVGGADIHEAYIVVADGELVGFYLPAKGTFSPLKKKRQLPLHPEGTGK